jgi:hypothetical protein
MFTQKKTKHPRFGSIDELIDIAGDESLDAPSTQIPPQRLPGWVRWPLRVIFCPFIVLDMAMQKFARILIPPPFKRRGKCLKRGNCCYYILFEEPHSFATKLAYWWGTEIQGFYQRYPHAFEHCGKRVVVMGCRYLKENRTCSHYTLRSVLCREWPFIEYFGRPQMLDGCGFHAELRSSYKKKKEENHEKDSE